MINMIILIIYKELKQILKDNTKQTRYSKTKPDSGEYREWECGAVGATSISSTVGSFSFLTMLFIPTFSQHWPNKSVFQSTRWEILLSQYFYCSAFSVLELWRSGEVAVERMSFLHGFSYGCHRHEGPCHTWRLNYSSLESFIFC
jgi:hypothetical protein